MNLCLEDFFSQTTVISRIPYSALDFGFSSPYYCASPIRPFANMPIRYNWSISLSS